MTTMFDYACDRDLRMFLGRERDEPRVIFVLIGRRVQGASVHDNFEHAIDTVERVVLELNRVDQTSNESLLSRLEHDEGVTVAAGG